MILYFLGVSMFGYVRVHKPELKVKEYELYRSAYCGLCRSMGKCTGQCSRMTLSYDFAFLALVRMTLLSESISIGKKRCIAHPLHKKTYVKNNPSLEFCSGAAAILNYHKVKDDIADEKGFKKLRSVLILPFVSHSRRKALKQGLSELDKMVSEGLSALSVIEKEKRCSVDEPAAVFGRILGDIMSYGLSDADRRVAYSLGVAVGKWIYIADALDDWSEDAKKGSYNPFILLYGSDAPSEEELSRIKAALTNELFAAEAAVDLIEFGDEGIKNIILNILYLGMPEKTDGLKFGDNGKNKKSSKNAKKTEAEQGAQTV